jgi:hypothetical protein
MSKQAAASALAEPAPVALSESEGSEGTEGAEETEHIAETEEPTEPDSDTVESEESAGSAGCEESEESEEAEESDEAIANEETEGAEDTVDGLCKSDQVAALAVLKDLVETVQDRSVSWLNGTLKVPAPATTLYVRDLGHIDFPYPPSERLTALYSAGEPASFGKGAETVFDENYRKGRALTTDKYSINLRPELALLDQIKAVLVNAGESQHSIVRAELYRVNVYGPGDFFKEHKDTPQSGQGHFGSLVFCLPTSFEGGTFVLRSPQGEEMKFDWGAKFAEGSHALAETAQEMSVVEYIAFASDLDHWIEPVVSGMRITVTFHLFREGKTSTDEVTRPIVERLINCAAVRAANELLRSKRLSGRNIAFPLVHRYSSSGKAVLKGGDASLFQMLKRLGVHPRVMWYYDRSLYDESDEYYYEQQGQNTNLRPAKWYLASDVESHLEYGIDESVYDGRNPPIEKLADPYEIAWARKPTNQQQTLTFVPYTGNEGASLTCYEGNICILTSW